MDQLLNAEPYKCRMYGITYIIMLYIYEHSDQLPKTEPYKCTMHVIKYILMLCI